MDFAIVAVNSISLEKGITDFRMEECGIIKAMISASRRTLVVADHTKFQRVACMNVCPLEDVSAFLTDGGLDSETAFLYRQAGADIVKPSPEGK